MLFLVWLQRAYCNALHSQQWAVNNICGWLDAVRIWSPLEVMLLKI